MTTYVTTPIYYVNAQPHLGHAYTTIVADCYGRFKRLMGEDVRFQTGTDEHGDKIAEAAKNHAIAPREYVDKISAMFRDTWPLLNIQYDHFIRTTDNEHIETVSRILQEVYDRGDIYFDEYTGLYCKGCERFLTEKELDGGNCPDHQKPPEEISETNYFFRMSKYQQQLIDHIRDNPDFITPERYRNEVLSFLSEPLEDLCISRPTSRLTWGIPLPFDDNYVTYVWFDALINYVSGIGYPDSESFDQYWSVAEHVIGKDILKPHAIYWPTMLMSMGLPLYKKLHVHGHWIVNEAKMSKSIGNVKRPEELTANFGVDGFRYFTLREMSFGLDASYSTEGIIDRINSDLANDLGNLFSRSLAMLKKYTGNVVPEPSEKDKTDLLLIETTSTMVDDYTHCMADFQFHKGLEAVWKLIRHANKYIVVNEPWSLAKDEQNRSRLDSVLYNLAECLRILSLILEPAIPQTAKTMQSVFGALPDIDNRIDLRAGSAWGLLEPGTKLGESPPLFPRIDKKQLQAGTTKEKQSKKQQSKTAKQQDESMIDFDQFKELDLRVAKIVAAEPISKSDRLLKLTVEAPEERVVVAGIAEYYKPEEIVGKLVIIVANLKPAKLMGVTSHGMVLAAVDGKGKTKKLVLSTLADQVEPGSPVS